MFFTPEIDSPIIHELKMNLKKKGKSQSIVISASNSVLNQMKISYKNHHTVIMDLVVLLAIYAMG